MHGLHRRLLLLLLSLLPACLLLLAIGRLHGPGRPAAATGRLVVLLLRVGPAPPAPPSNLRCYVYISASLRGV